MTKYGLYDAVALKEALILADGATAWSGTQGTIVEVLGDGEAYLVELFGGWVMADAAGTLIPAERSNPESFMETIGVEMVRSQQLRLIQAAEKVLGVRSHLLATLDELPDALVVEVADFADFLRQKQQRHANTGERVS